MVNLILLAFVSINLTKELIMSKDRTPNDQRSDVKNPNNYEYELDQQNRENQREQHHQDDDE
jgi:hypothetical protein